jgi:hypothetical protein
MFSGEGHVQSVCIVLFGCTRRRQPAQIGYGATSRDASGDDSQKRTLHLNIRWLAMVKRWHILYGYTRRGQPAQLKDSTSSRDASGDNNQKRTPISIEDGWL